MPVYEYRCSSCQNVFEYQQRMADAPKTVCETCNGTLERLISRSAFQFKGGGWYKDLYASSKPSESTPTPSTAASTSTSESKPAASSDSSASSAGGAGSASPAAAGPAK